MFQILHGDSLDVLSKWDDNTFDSVVTDPPYGLSMPSPEEIAAMLAAWVTEGDFEIDKTGFMNASWDAMVPSPAIWREVLRVLKPGGYAVVFAGARTQDLMGISLRLAGFEVRETLMWLYGSGMPHGLNIQKALEKRGSDLADQWEGWNTNLKPSYEPIIMARKPIEGSIADNVETYGVGAINIDGCRTETSDPYVINRFTDGAKPFGNGAGHPYETVEHTQGRWPSNALLDSEAAEVVDKQGGYSKSVRGKRRLAGSSAGNNLTLQTFKIKEDVVTGYTDEGGVSRFFNIFDGDEDDVVRVQYIKKASVKEREYGLDSLKDPDSKTRVNTHPTVKPVKLMRWLCRLVTPKGGIILDPFGGSGTTAVGGIHEGFSVVCIDLDERSVQIAKARAERAVQDVEGAA